MTILHMETDSVRTMAGQMKQTVESLRSQMQSLNSFAQAIDWMGPSRDEFMMEAEAVIRQSEAQIEAGIALASRVDNEVVEWESSAATFDYGEHPSSPGIFFVPIIVGGVIITSVVYAVWWSQQTIKGLSRDEALKKIEDILDNTKAGREALQKAKELGVNFELSTAGSGTYYDPDPPPGTMYIDPNSQQDVASSSYIHELTHAVQNAAGSFPDPKVVSKQDYVDGCIRNEADAVIAELRYEKENPMLNIASQPEYESAYWNTYNQKMKELQHSNANLSQAEMENIANSAGREKVIEAFKDGTIKTSTTHQSYVDYYGDGWEQVKRM